MKLLVGVEDGRRRHGKLFSNKTWKRWVLAGMEPAGSPVLETDGDFSSPDAPRETGRPKSRSKLKNEQRVDNVVTCP